MADKKVPVRLQTLEGTDFTKIFIAVFAIVITLGKSQQNTHMLTLPFVYFIL